MSRADAAGLVADSRGGPDEVAAEASAIRSNLEEMAADRPLGLITRRRSRCNRAANLRLDEIGAEMEAAADVLARW